jgi:ABC-2 type transport system ATP-binding protein
MTSRGTTVFFSSHVMEVVEKLCSRLAIISKGTIVAEGTLDDLRAQNGNPNSSLEDIFVDLVGGRNIESSGLSDDLRWLNTESETV